MIKHVNKMSDFQSKVLENNNVVLVDFYAAWCSPCKRLSAELEKLSSSRSNYEIIKVNLDELKDLARRYNINAIPTLVVFKDGQPVDRMIGVDNEEKIADLISRHL